MFSSRKKTNSISEIVSYTYPTLHTGKVWYIDFMAYDPVAQKMKRKKYNVPPIKGTTARKNYASEMIYKLTAKLREGWNPWVTATTKRQYTLYKDVIEWYHLYITKLHKTGSIKTTTLTDYKKRLKVLEEYTSKVIQAPTYSYQFDQYFCSDFLDYILLDRDASARTRNNYRTWLSSLANWMLEKQYIDSNPIENIKPLKEDGKHRTALSPSDLKKMKTYLEKENPHYLLLCQFAYYTFIRPDEITNIRLQDIHLSEQKVFVASSISKNRRDGMVGLNDKLIKAMLDLKVFDKPNHYYLFGKDFKPSETKNTTRVYRNMFYKVRAALRWPDTYQFYSLKDSGIRDLANAEGIVVARDQARHTDISTTNKYLKGDSMSVHEETKHFEGNL